MKYRIFVVEDDPSIRELVANTLEPSGHRVIPHGDGAGGLNAMVADEPDLAILDWNLPGISGVQIAQALRRHPRTARLPILMLTVYSTTDNRVEALKSGADDYMTKPFDPRELRLRVQALLHRGHHPSAVLSYGGIELDPQAHRATAGGRVMSLRPREFQILRVLIASPERTVPRRQILERVCGAESDTLGRTLDTHIVRIRKELRSYAPLLQTVPGVGYRLEAPQTKVRKGS